MHTTMHVRCYCRALCMQILEMVHRETHPQLPPPPDNIHYHHSIHSLHYVDAQRSHRSPQHARFRPDAADVSDRSWRIVLASIIFRPCPSSLLSQPIAPLVNPNIETTASITSPPPSLDRRSVGVSSVKQSHRCGFHRSIRCRSLCGRHRTPLRQQQQQQIRNSSSKRSATSTATNS